MKNRRVLNPRLSASIGGSKHQFDDDPAGDRVSDRLRSFRGSAKLGLLPKLRHQEFSIVNVPQRFTNRTAMNAY